MIVVKVHVEVNGMTLEYEKEVHGHTVAGGDSVRDAEKAQALLLEAYHKINKGIESQK